MVTKDRLPVHGRSSVSSDLCLRIKGETLLDEPNRQLVQALQADGRLSLAELGRRVGLSAPAVAERLGRLEREGVIRGYRADVDPAAVGYPLSAVIRIRPAPRERSKAAALA